MVKTNKAIEIPNLIGFFSDCEKKYEVSNWKLGGIHVWPVIKIIIYFNLYRKVPKVIKDNSWRNRINKNWQKFYLNY